MDEYTIKALLELNLGPVVTEGKKVLLIPYEDVLRGKIRICYNKEEKKEEPATIAQLLTVPQPKAKLDTIPLETTDEVVIPVEIMKLYPTEALKNTMVEDVTEYLKEIARCWEYHNLGFTQSLLKKAAKARPALNSVVLKAYGKDGDIHLTALVKANHKFIREHWNDDSPLNQEE